MVSPSNRRKWGDVFQKKRPCSVQYLFQLLLLLLAKTDLLTFIVRNDTLNLCMQITVFRVWNSVKGAKQREVPVRLVLENKI